MILFSRSLKDLSSRSSLFLKLPELTQLLPSSSSLVPSDFFFLVLFTFSGVSSAVTSLISVSSGAALSGMAAASSFIGASPDSCLVSASFNALLNSSSDAKSYAGMSLSDLSTAHFSSTTGWVHSSLVFLRDRASISSFFIL